MAGNYKVLPYAIDTLGELITEAADKQTSRQEIENKSHLNYFAGYFAELKAQTIVVEKEYTDRYYTEDYSEYYVRCFHPYEKTCSRLHFFDQAFTSDDFTALISGDDSAIDTAQLQESYLGFVVIKPLPITVIGRTCLKIYPQNGTRFYPIVRSYKVNLFGINLKCTATLAFQEQDSVVAACATSALWSVFHGTGILFHHQIPSPSQITKLATQAVSVNNRTFPNHGLTSEMMAHAIKAVSLEPHLEKVQDLHWLQCNLYAYLRAKIPIVLGVDLVDITDTKKPGELLGKHAVAVTGHNLGGATFSPPNDPNMGRFWVEATKIDKIYVHDDQVGPFSRVTLDHEPINIGIPGSEETREVTGNLKTNFRPDRDIRAIPDIILVPLYHKVRIPFAEIYKTIAEFNEIFEYITNQSIDPLEWDIFLNESNDFKAELFDQLPPGAHRTQMLLQPRPRFVWRAIVSMAGHKFFEFTFDATDIDQGNYFLDGVVYDEIFCGFLKKIASNPELPALVAKSMSRHLFAWLRDLEL